jgi:hypothetical protein
MCEVLAALRLGFLSRQIRNLQEAMWTTQAPSLAAVTKIIKDADRALHGLSNCLNGYQRSTVVELWETLYDSLSIAPHRLLGCSGVAKSILKKQQQELWNDLRAMLAAIITGERRLAAWFDLGDRLADISWQIYEGLLPLPLTPQQWDFLYSGVDRLSRRERRIIGPFFPARYNNHLHLACQLLGTYRGLCGLLQSVGDDILAVPSWDGTTLCYRGRQAGIKRQANSIIIPILDEFEMAGWPEHVLLRKGLDGDVKQAVYHFNKLGIVRLSQDGAGVRW